MPTIDGRAALHRSKGVGGPRVLPGRGAEVRGREDPSRRSSRWCTFGLPPPALVWLTVEGRVVLSARGSVVTSFSSTQPLHTDCTLTGCEYAAQASPATQRNRSHAYPTQATATIVPISTDLLAFSMKKWRPFHEEAHTTYLLQPLETVRQAKPVVPLLRHALPKSASPTHRAFNATHRSHIMGRSQRLIPTTPVRSTQRV